MLNENFIIYFTIVILDKLEFLFKISYYEIKQI